MSPNSKKQVLKTTRYPSWFRHLIRYLYGVGLFSIGAAVVLLVFVTVAGELFSEKGLFLILYISVFLVLLYLKKQFEKDE